MTYWSTQDISLEGMIQHLFEHAKKYFYDISIVEITEKPIGWKLDIGWHINRQIQLEKGGWTITGKGFLLYFDEEMLLTWNGKYIPMSMGTVFTLGKN